jgi:hypothetical protein
VISRRTVVVFSLIVILVGSSIALVGFSGVQRKWLSLLRSSYVSRYHKFWIGLAVFSFYFYILRQISMRKRIYEFLNSFKAFPLISPVFCFGGPVFWKDSLAILGITGRIVKSIGVMSFLSGILFLIGLIIFYVFVHPERSKPSSKIELFVPAIIKRKRYKHLYLTESISLVSIFSGLALLTYVTFVIVYLALVS